jgi:hypothetical protein
MQAGILAGQSHQELLVQPDKAVAATDFREGEPKSKARSIGDSH